MAGVDVLRVLWSEGVRVVMRDDGPRLIAEPGVTINADVIQLAKDAKPEIITVASHLPASGRCCICGDEIRMATTDANGCTTCSLLAAERLGIEVNDVAIEMTCSVCGAAYTVTREDVILPPAIYRQCPACRPQPTPKAA